MLTDAVSSNTPITQKSIVSSNTGTTSSQQIEVSCFDEACAHMAKNSYKDYDLNLKGWSEVKNYARDNWNGFRAKVFQKDGKIIIAYAGTDSIGDYISDIQMSLRFTPSQYHDAMELYLQIANDPAFKSKEIYVTGHSLGGSLAQLVAATDKYKGKEIPNPPRAITFNAYGQKKLIDEEDDADDETILEDNNNTTNYFIQGDYVSGATREDALANHPGEIIMFDDELKKTNITLLDGLINPFRQISLKYGSDREDSLSKYHTIEHFVKSELSDNYKSAFVLRESGNPTESTSNPWIFNSQENGFYFSLKDIEQDLSYPTKEDIFFEFTLEEIPKDTKAK